MKHFILLTYLFFDRRGRRQLFWLGILIGITIAITDNNIIQVIIIILSLTTYIVWITIGHYIFTVIKAKHLLTQAKKLNGYNLVDVSKQLDFNAYEKYLGQFTMNKFIPVDVDLDKPFHGIIACINKFSFHRRFVVSLVEIDGKKFVRKRYTPCDDKFYRGLRNNLLVQPLNISPPIKYISIPDRTLWIEFVEGTTLTTLSDNSILSDIEIKNLINKLNEFDSALHNLGLCNLDLHRGNIIIRESDGQPIFIDLDEQRLFTTKNLIFKLRSQIDRIKLIEEFDLLIKSSQQNGKVTSH